MTPLIQHKKTTPVFFVAFVLGCLTVSLQAGEPVAYKQVAPPPPELYGVGFYGAIDGGANVYQNTFDNTTFTQDDPGLPFLGYSLEANPHHDVGFFGGIIRSCKETLSIAAMCIGKTASQPSYRNRTTRENDAVTQMTNFCGNVTIDVAFPSPGQP